MKRYVRSGSELDQYIVSDEFYNEIKSDGIKLINKLERYKDAVRNIYGDGVASFVDDAIYNINTSIEQAHNRVVRNRKKLNSATNTCNIGMKANMVNSCDYEEDEMDY